MQNVINPPTRRNLFAGATAIATMAILPASGVGVMAYGWRYVDTSVSHPDAALITLCATFATACADLARINATDDPSDDELDAVVGAWAEPINAIIATPATTLAGAKVKAQAVIDYFANSGGVSKYRWETVEDAMVGHEKMAWALAHEIVAMGSAVA